MLDFSATSNPILLPPSPSGIHPAHSVPLADAIEAHSRTDMGAQHILAFAREYARDNPSRRGSAAAAADTMLTALLSFSGTIDVIPTYPLASNLWKSPPACHPSLEDVMQDAAAALATPNARPPGTHLVVTNPATGLSIESPTAGSVMSACLLGFQAPVPVCLLDIPASRKGLFRHALSYLNGIPLLSQHPTWCKKRELRRKTKKHDRLHVHDLRGTACMSCTCSTMHFDSGALPFWLCFCQEAAKLIILIPLTPQNRTVLERVFPETSDLRLTADMLSRLDAIEVHFQSRHAAPTLLKIPGGRYHIFITGTASAHFSQFYATAEDWESAREALEWQFEVIAGRVDAGLEIESLRQHMMTIAEDLNAWRELSEMEVGQDPGVLQREFPLVEEHFLALRSKFDGLP